MAVLNVLSSGGGEVSDIYELADFDVTIGRGYGAQIVLDDQSVSRAHAMIVPTSRGFYIIELDSTNGIWVDGQRAASHFLRDGEVFRLGNTDLQYQTADPRAAQTIQLSPAMVEREAASRGPEREAAGRGPERPPTIEPRPQPAWTGDVGPLPPKRSESAWGALIVIVLAVVAMGAAAFFLFTG